MPKRIHLRHILLTTAAVATVAGLTASPALAAVSPGLDAATWTISPGGSVTGTAGTTTLKDTSTGTTLTCTSSTAKGSLSSGSGLSNPLGSIASISFSSCTGPLGISFTASVTGPLPLTGTSYASGVSDLTISKIHGTLSGLDCSAVVDGTSGSADNGTVDATYTNSSAHLQALTTGGTLHIYDVSGCFSLIKNGDAATFASTYTISPAQTVTSP
jgi:hypothetical protein